MTKLKGVKNLNDSITKELKPFGITRAHLSSEYSYLYYNRNINYKITETALEDKWFIDFVKERFNYTVRYPFVFSLLHEVGHHKANDEIEGAIYEFCTAEKTRIEKTMKNVKSEAKAKKLEWQYFNLPDEIMATQWAVNYCKQNPQKINNMWKNMKKALYEFYDANGVLNDDNIEE